jgi:hypothetical protein
MTKGNTICPRPFYGGGIIISISKKGKNKNKYLSKGGK